MSDCVIDLASSGVLKHYIGDEYGIKCQRERCPHLIYRDHCLMLLRNGKNGNRHSSIILLYTGMEIQDIFKDIANPDPANEKSGSVCCVH